MARSGEVGGRRRRELVLHVSECSARRSVHEVKLAARRARDRVVSVPVIFRDFLFRPALNPEPGFRAAEYEGCHIRFCTRKPSSRICDDAKGVAGFARLRPVCVRPTALGGLGGRRKGQTQSQSDYAETVPCSTFGSLAAYFICRSDGEHVRLFSRALSWPPRAVVNAAQSRPYMRLQP